MSAEAATGGDDDHESDNPRSLRPPRSSFADFLLPAIHTILYLRNVYPAASFLSCRAYDFAVHQSRHPTVCAWISDAVSNLEAELAKGVVRRVALVLVHPQTSQPLERFVWDIHDSQAEHDQQESDAPNMEDAIHGGGGGDDVDDDDNDQDDDDTASEADAHEQIRTLLSRLTVCVDRLLPIPVGCTFTLAIELDSANEASDLGPPTWINSAPSQSSHHKGNAAGDTETSMARQHENQSHVNKTISLPAIASDEMTFEMWIEEGRTKTLLPLKT